VELIQLWLPNAADSAKTFLEFIDASFGVHKLGKSSEERMRIRSDADRDQAVFHTVNNFLLLRSFRRTGNETFAGGHINEDDRIVFRMKVLFHES
jgi:hypothetical protein